MTALEALVRDRSRSWVPDRPGYALYIRPIVFSTEQHLEVRPSTSYPHDHPVLPGGDPISGHGGAAGLALKVEDEIRPHCTPWRGRRGQDLGQLRHHVPRRSDRAREDGFDQVLWLDGAEHRYVEEAGLMNVFFKIGDRVLTPALDGAILPGITRASAITLIEDHGVALEQRRIAIEEVADACSSGALEEIFVTGTAAVVLPVGRLHLKGRDLVPFRAAQAPLTGWLHDALSGIQYGRHEDRRGWTRIIA